MCVMSEKSSRCCDEASKGPFDEVLGCPRCGRKGRPVSELTVKQQVAPEHLEAASGEGNQFCGTPDCAVVYFVAGGQVFEQKDLRQKVGLKDRSDPSPVCYCFGFTRRMVEDEVRSTGRSTIPDRIAREVKAGNCACEARNPQGSCCLGNVTAAVKEAERGG